MRKTWVVGFAAALLVLAGCGGDESADDTPAPGAGGSNTTMAAGHTHGGGEANTNCTATGNTITVVASGVSFQTDCLAATMGQPYTVSFDNKDDVTHNIVFLESHNPGAAVFFRADLVTAKSTKTFSAGPFTKAGVFAFHCEIHPDRMSGAFVVK